eukprot:4085587-Pyramimonas_sp.AAC.1
MLKTPRATTIRDSGATSARCWYLCQSVWTARRWSCASSELWMFMRAAAHALPYRPRGLGHVLGQERDEEASRGQRLRRHGEGSLETSGISAPSPWMAAPLRQRVHNPLVRRGAWTRVTRARVFIWNMIR